MQLIINILKPGVLTDGSQLSDVSLDANVMRRKDYNGEYNYLGT